MENTVCMTVFFCIRKIPAGIFLLVELFLDFAEIFLLNDLVNNGLDGNVERTVFAVISFFGKVDTAMVEQVLGNGFVIIIDTDGMTAVVPDDLHSWDISHAIPHIYHVCKRHIALAAVEIGIYFLVIIHLQGVFVDAEDELGLGSIVYCDGRPVGIALVVIMEFTGIHSGKLVIDIAAFQDLLGSGRDDEMLYLHTSLTAIFIYSSEVLSDPGIILDHFTQSLEVFSFDIKSYATPPIF